VTSQQSCPSCQSELPAGAAYCPSCGTASPTVITNERAVASAPAGGAGPSGPLAGVGTADRLARALGPKYEVRRLVGRGGFAEVYELWDKDLERRLACKVLHPEVAWTPGMLARFQQEAKALARLQHAAILPIHFTGAGEGLVFYVMPFVEGESLADALRRRRLYSSEEALTIAEPILQALSHAHAQGLVHRDIKPDNVMLEAKTGRVLLVDFGIAKLLDPSGGEGRAKTATGFTVGTVQYMSPEQALGQPHLDGRSDLYAFGALLFQMVTGAPPYDGNSSAEIVGKHLADPIPVASDVNARIPRWLSDVIVKCLAKKPEDRFQNADAVIDALRVGRASGSDRLVSAQAVKREVRRSGEAQSRGSRKVGWWIGGVVAAMLVAGWAARRAGYLGSGVVFVHNALVEPIELSRDGGPVDTVAPEGTARLELSSSTSPGLRWRLLRPGNPPIGEPMEGPVPPFQRVEGRAQAGVTAELEGQRYFAPLVTNASASAITVLVNPGTAAAVQCDCLVPEGAVRTHIGYYRLFVNSSVAAYNSAHPYIGPHTDRDGFAARVTPESGAVVLDF
jgi:serine/threonine protein kinase